MDRKVVSGRKVKKCRKCGNAIINYRHKSKPITVDVFQDEDSKLCVILKNGSVLEHRCITK